MQTRHMGNYFKTSALLVAVAALFMAIGYFVAGSTGILIALGVSLAMTLFSFWQSEKMALSFARAKPLPRRDAAWLHEANEQLSERAGIPAPRLFISPEPQPNAFACGRGPGNASVCVNIGLLQAMSEREVIGVLAHEIAHIKNRDVLIMSIVAAFSQAIMFLQWFAIFLPFGDEDGPNPIALIGTLILAPIAGMAIQMTVSRTREYAADKTAAELMKDPLPLADALGTLGRVAKVMPSRTAKPATAHMYIAMPLHVRGLLKIFSTHPPMEERIRRLNSLVGKV